MNASDVIKLLHESIRAAKEAGTDPLLIKRLEAFATEINNIVQESQTTNALTEAELERYKAKLSAWVESRQHAHEWDLEMLRSVIVTGQFALKSSLLINGAAAVALLTFIGNIWNKDLTVVAGTAYALGSYVVGVMLAAVAVGITYLSQAGFGREFGKHSHAIGNWGRFVAVILVIASYIAFGCASFLAYRVFTGTL